jgi:hypothetical protein
VELREVSTEAGRRSSYIRGGGPLGGGAASYKNEPGPRPRAHGGQAGSEAAVERSPPALVGSASTWVPSERSKVAAWAATKLAEAVAPRW